MEIEAAANLPEEREEHIRKGAFRAACDEPDKSCTRG